MQHNLDGLQKNQAEILRTTQEFAGGWMTRRQNGVQTAVESAKRICAARTPAAAVAEYQTWAAGAWGRFLAEGTEFQKYFATMAGLTLKPPSAD